MCSSSSGCSQLAAPTLFVLLFCFTWAFSVPVAAEDVWYAPEICPQWLVKYKKFHDENKASPNAHYMVYWCTGTMSCSGLGDRLRGIMYLLRVAYAYNLILIIHMDQPVDVRTFLLPNQIDWTIDHNVPKDVDFFKAPMDSGAFWKATGKDNRTEFLNTKVTKIVTNEFYDWDFFGDNVTGLTPLMKHPKGEGSFVDVNTPYYVGQGVCLFRFLFKINPEVEKQADAKTKLLYGTERKDYVAWHWRGGGQVGEEVQFSGAYGLSRMAILMLGSNCVKSLARDAGIKGTKALLVTDTNPVRTFVAEGNLAGLTATADVAVMIDRVAKPDLNTYMPIFVDMVMLSRAKCILYSKSGVSYTAGFIGNFTRCMLKIDECLGHQLSDLHGIII